jgi:chemotaxis protein CheX
MSVSTQDVKRIVCDVCEQALHVSPKDGDTDVISSASQRQMAAYVHIAGAWHGTITLQCPGELSTRVAGAMFGIDPGEVSLRDELDSLGELANMIGGNVKSLLPGPSHLSLPTVIDGVSYLARVPGSKVYGRYHFDCEGWPLVVGLFEREERASSAREFSPLQSE